MPSHHGAPDRHKRDLLFFSVDPDCEDSLPGSVTPFKAPLNEALLIAQACPKGWTIRFYSSHDMRFP